MRSVRLLPGSARVPLQLALLALAALAAAASGGGGPSVKRAARPAAVPGADRVIFLEPGDNYLGLVEVGDVSVDHAGEGEVAASECLGPKGKLAEGTKEGARQLVRNKAVALGATHVLIAREWRASGTGPQLYDHCFRIVATGKRRGEPLSVAPGPEPRPGSETIALIRTGGGGDDLRNYEEVALFLLQHGGKGGSGTYRDGCVAARRGDLPLGTEDGALTLARNLALGLGATHVWVNDREPPRQHPDGFDHCYGITGGVFRRK